MRSRLMLGVWLVVAWLAFWRDVSFANVVSGVGIATATIWLFPPVIQPGRLSFNLWPTAKFLTASLRSIIRANLIVAWEVVTPTNQINEGVVAVELASNHPVVITLVSHAIILAPGTMVVDIEVGDETSPTWLYVHVLHLRSIEEVRAEVIGLEALAMAAVSNSGREGGSA